MDDSDGDVAAIAESGSSRPASREPLGASNTASTSACSNSSSGSGSSSSSGSGSGSGSGSASASASASNDETISHDQAELAQGQSTSTGVSRASHRLKLKQWDEMVVEAAQYYIAHSTPPRGAT